MDYFIPRNSTCDTHMRCADAVLMTTCHQRETMLPKKKRKHTPTSHTGGVDSCRFPCKKGRAKKRLHGANVLPPRRGTCPGHGETSRIPTKNSLCTSAPLPRSSKGKEPRPCHQPNPQQSPLHENTHASRAQYVQQSKQRRSQCNHDMRAAYTLCSGPQPVSTTARYKCTT